jgi:hypothetical protein
VGEEEKGRGRLPREPTGARGKLNENHSTTEALDVFREVLADLLRHDARQLEILDQMEGVLAILKTIPGEYSQVVMEKNIRQVLDEAEERQRRIRKPAPGGVPPQILRGYDDEED